MKTFKVSKNKIVLDGQTYTALKSNDSEFNYNFFINLNNVTYVR